MTTLEQKTLMSTDTYTLEYNGVRLRQAGMNKNVELLIPFENIPPGQFFQRVFQKGAIITAMFFGVLAFFVIVAQILNRDTFPQPRGLIITVMLILIPAAALWFTRREYIGFGLPGKGVIFDATKPSRQAVATFMQQLHTAKVAYLREVYLNSAEPAPASEVLRRLIWLTEMGALTQEEFNEGKKGIEEITSAGAPLGFKQ